VAVALDASTPAKATGTGTSITTVSFTPPSGSLIEIHFATNNTSSGTDASISSITNTGTAITWTRQARKNKNTGSTGGTGEPGGAEIWTGVGNGGAITITVNGVGSGTGFEKLVKPLVWTGADTTTFNVAAASSASGTPSVTVASCLAGSFVSAVSSDWAQKGLGTAGTGQTIVDETNVSGQISTHVWRLTSALGANGSQTMNLTAPTLEDYNLVAMEIRAASGGSSFSGSASLSGSGTLTLSGTPAETGTLGLSGSGTLTLSGTPAETGALGLSGSGTLTTSAVPAIPGTLGLSGSGTLTGAGAPAFAGSAALSGSGTLSLVGSVAYVGSATLSGAGTLTLSGVPTPSGQLTLSGSGTLTASGVVGGGSSDFSGLVMLTGSGSLSASGTAALSGSVAFGGTGILTISAGGTVYRFDPPGRMLSSDPTGEDFLWSKVKYFQGDAVIKYLDGSFKQVSIWNPDEPGVDKVYMGGHVHMLSDAEAVLLIQAGYGPYLTVVSG
jgi:hypothetical protein